MKFRKLICFTALLSILSIQSFAGEFLPDNNRLSQLGFSEQEIADMTPQELDNLENLEGKLISKKSNYMLVTPTASDGIETKTLSSVEANMFLTSHNRTHASQDNNTYQPNGNAYFENSSLLTISFTASDMGYQNGTHRYYYKNSFDWLTGPAYTLNDLIGISVDNVGIINNTETLVYKHDYRTLYSSPETRTHISNSARISASGAGFTIPLAGTDNPNFQWTEKHRGYMSFSGFILNNSNSVNSGLAEYRHAYSNSTESFSVSFPLGISLTSSSESKYYTPLVERLNY